MLGHDRPESAVTMLRNTHSGFGLPPPYRKREGEILAWLQLHDAVDEPWVALDDAYWQFDHCKDRLVVCGSFTGFDEKVSTELRARFGFEEASQ